MAALIRALATALTAAALTAQVTPITVEDRRYLSEPAKNGQLHLHPDNCFFNGGGLRCIGKGSNTDDPLNKGRSFTTIAGLTASNEVCWYVHLPAAGDYTINLRAQSGTGMHLLCGQQRIAFNDIAGTGTASLHLDRAGVHCLRVHHDSKQPTTLKQLTVIGDGIDTASVLRTRWRPAAAHTRFSSSTCSEGSLVWIMEMDAAPGRARFYSPMTTPFGYFGPSWTREGKPTGLNFSMWSYGRGKPEPPIAQLSHLLAVGNPKARFNGFGHEGTGVKPRGWNPFEEWQGDRCVLALRMEPGTPYDTYHGYIFDEKTREWQLYAAGRKQAKKRRRAKRQQEATSLWAGSFVEVPGPPQRQRTGHIVREMRYRGFVLDKDRNPHVLDHMTGPRKTPVGNQGRGLTDDGRFRMWIGGMEQFETSPAVTLEAKPDHAELEWLQPDKLAALFTWPTTVKVHSITAVENALRVHLTVQGLGKLTRATLHYGASDALTLAARWDHASEHLELVEGEQTIDVALPKNGGRTAANVRFARMLVENDRGRFWSLQTATAGK